MIKDQDIKNAILLSKIEQIDIDIEAYQNAIMDNTKGAVAQETIDFYQTQISELGLMKNELEKLQ
ncbi:MAG: hypothetical protein EBW76_08175 [Actinobacteria bacterium]|jgi:hypothetical protein|nr:hypothetical protein [Actinomycetota bacterium]